MKILLDTELSVAPMASFFEGAISESEIILHGAPSGKFVAGTVLETSIKWNKFYLLFMTDDTPYEDVLSISLLDKQLNVLDTAMLGGIYTTGSFSLLDLIDPNIVIFRFFGDTDWHIELFVRPFLTFPFLFEPAGVSRRLNLLHYFKLHGNPKPK